MAEQVSRRTALSGLAAGAGMALVADEAKAQARLPAADIEVVLAQVSPTCVRITVTPLVDGRAVAVPDDGVLVAQETWPVKARLRPHAAPATVVCGELKVTLSSDPLAVSVHGADGREIQRIRIDPTGGFGFALGQGPLFGLGQGGPQFDRRGDVDDMSSGQGGYALKTNGSREPIPWLIGAAGWGLFVHHPQGGFDLGGAEGRFRPQAPGAGVLDLFVVGAREPAEILRDYARITGFAEMPPLWSLGYQQSHRTLGSPEEIIAEARKFRDKKLPCDAMIYLGTGFCPNGWNTDNGEFGWNPRAFPEPQRALDDLHGMNFKVVLHAVLEGHVLSGKVSDPCTAAPLPSGRTPDGHWPHDRQVACYWPVHKPLVDMGVDGWWPDQGDGLDAPSRLARNRMYFEGQQLYRPNKRVYALHRNTYAGMQRYAAFLWSGDVGSTWETLRTHVPVAINTGLSGIPYWGTDIGGFVPSEEYTGELFARWFQFAAFNPLFRSHGRDWRMHLPWGWSEGVRGAPETPKWNPDPATLHDPRIEPICRKYLELRYRLMPYLYSTVRETCDSGLPVIRAMWLHHADDALAASRGDQYLYGRDLLVAPVTEKGATRRSLYLPKGEWHDFWTHERMQGGREIVRPVDLETIPLYVRAGAVIPMGPVKQHTGEVSDEPLTLWVYPGADGGGVVYEDDGDSFDYRRGAFGWIKATWSDGPRELVVAQKGSVRGARRLRVVVAGGAVREVSLGDAPVTVRL